MIARGVLVGFGRMGSYHLRALLSRRDATVAAVVDPDPGRRADVPAGIATFADLADALKAVSADFACLAAPVHRLPALARTAIDAGLAVMIEKPMAQDEEAARTVVRAAEERGVVLAVGLVERCNPAVEALRLMLCEQTAGQVYQVHARRLSPYPGRESPVGVALDLGTHDVDVIRFITGSEIDRVYAETFARAGNVHEDLVSATLRLESGATGMLDVNWMTPTKVRQLSVTCEGGLFVLDYLTQDLTFYQRPRSDIEWDTLRMMRGTGEGDMIRYGIARREPLMIQWDRFLAALAGEGSPAASGNDGIAALSIARSIQLSASDGSAVVPSYRTITTR